MMMERKQAEQSLLRTGVEPLPPDNVRQPHVLHFRTGTFPPDNYSPLPGRFSVPFVRRSETYTWYRLRATVATMLTLLGSGHF